MNIYKYITIIFLLSIPLTSQGTIISLGNDVFFDDIEGQYWFRDLSYFTNADYFEQLNLIDQLTLSGNATYQEQQGAWRFALQEDLNNIAGNYGVDEFVNQFNHTVVNSTGPLYYGRIGDPSLTVQDATWSYVAQSNSAGNIINGSIGSLGYATSSSFIGAWVVADAIVSVPAPGTLWLFLSGIIFLSLSRKIASPYKR